MSQFPPGTVGRKELPASQSTTVSMGSWISAKKHTLNTHRVETKTVRSEIPAGTKIKSKPVYVPVVHPGHRKDRAVAIATRYSAETLR